MIRSLFISKTGLDAQQTQLDVISNNLANVSTSGFKKSRAVFEDLLYQTLRQPGAQSTQQTQLPTGLQIGTGVRPVASERIFTQGNLQQTGNQLDVAVNGQGFIQVALPDGTTAYTRDGSLHQDSQGQLVTSSGYIVAPGITIPAGYQSLSIGKDGVVSVLGAGQSAPTQVGSLQLVDFVNPTGLQPRGQNLVVESAASGTAQAGTPGLNGLGTLEQGSLESSNVNVVEELVNMIATQRAYEINSKAIQTSDQMLQRLSQL